jgi:hypothetical protein
MVDEARWVFCGLEVSAMTANVHCGQTQAGPATDRQIKFMRINITIFADRKFAGFNCTNSAWQVFDSWETAGAIVTFRLINDSWLVFWHVAHKY